MPRPLRAIDVMTHFAPVRSSWSGCSGWRCSPCTSTLASVPSSLPPSTGAAKTSSTGWSAASPRRPRATSPTSRRRFSYRSPVRMRLQGQGPWPCQGPWPSVADHAAGVKGLWTRQRAGRTDWRTLREDTCHSMLRPHVKKEIITRRQCRGIAFLIIDIFKEKIIT